MQKYFDRMIKDIQDSIKFDSSLAPAAEGAPFGVETRKCLDHFLGLAQGMGFETHNYDGYVGEVIFGEGEEFAILAHLDVVPAGNGWKYPPFDGVIADGKLYGRGTMDDKGPAIICLYALYALKEEGVLPKRKFKLIVGCNEETGWRCMDYYKKVATMPEVGFTPDADFPVIYAEKGIVHMTLKFPIANAPFTSMVGGSAANMVCDLVTAKVTAEGTLLVDGYDSDIKVKGTTLAMENGVLTAHGISAHGSMPDRGANALQAMLAYFASVGGSANGNADIARAYDVLFNDCLGLREMCDVTGHLTYSPDMVKFENGVLEVVTDFRYPSTHKLEEVTDILTRGGVEFVMGHAQEPLFNDPNGSLIQTLLGVYNRVSGKNDTPIAIGGGTYARVLKFGCGFGPQFEEDEVTIHQPNEYISLDRVRQLADIYYLSIKELAK